jgi:putative ABC transport system permease protein
MIQHWFKIIWNKKRQHFLMSLEMFASFLVVCVLFIQAARVYYNYQEPLGFQYRQIWVVSFDTKESGNEWQKNDHAGRFKRLTDGLEGFPEVLGVAGMDLLPFDYSNWNQGDSIPGENIQIERTSVTDNLLPVMGLQLVEGEWYNSAHDALPYSPVVITEGLAKKAFGGESPIGKRIFPILDESMGERYQELMAKGEHREQRVVGVVKAYRKNGELEETDPVAFRRAAPADTIMTRMPQHIVLRVEEGAMSAQFEEKAMKLLESMEPQWTFYLRPLEKLRERRFRETVLPLTSFGLVAGFLLVMVGLGLIGVLWQNITARRPEIGLRRALGADQGSIFMQILGELLVLCTVSLAAGSLIVWQFPLLEIMQEIPAKAYATGWLAAVIFLYLLTILCGLYPSYMATAISPTEALHDE